MDRNHDFRHVSRGELFAYNRLVPVPRLQTVFRAVGLAACGLVALQGSLGLIYDGPEALGFILVANLALLAVFAAAFWWNTGRSPAQPPTRLELALLALQMAFGLFASTDLLFIVAAEVPFVLRGRAAVAWLAAQSLATVGLSLVLIRSGEFVPVETLTAMPAGWLNALTVLSVIVWQWLAFAAGWMAASATRDRFDLARLNAELLAAQGLLAESSRLAERLQISRDLHDSLGHHLAALTVNLQLASRLAEGRAAQPVNEAHALARLLLGEVREVVGALRDRRGTAGIDLPGALQTLAAGAVDLEVHLAIPVDLQLRDPEQATALFRCAQEALTNTLKHAGARHLWLELAPGGEGGVELRARDDGQGSAEVVAGHGLTGMRERLAGLGGRLEIATGPGRGFRLTAWLPGAPGAAEAA